MSNYGWSLGNKIHNFDRISTAVFAIGRIKNNLTQVLGTAFLLPKKGLFATASHCIGLSDEGLVVIINSIASINDYQQAEPTQFSVMPAKIVAQDPMHDLVILETPWEGATNINIASSDNATVGTELVSFGFPHANYGRHVLTRHETAVGARILLPSPSLNAKYLVLNSLARPGQSGSPIFRKDDGRLVAILSGAYIPQRRGYTLIGDFDPGALHQTTHAVSAEYLRDML